MNTPLVVEGRATYLLVAMAVIALCAVGAPLYYRETLPDFCVENAYLVLLTTAAVELLLLTYAAFVAARRMLLEGSTLSYVTWFTERHIPLHSLTEVVVRKEYEPDAAPTTYIVFRGAAGVLLRVNPMFWDRAAFAVLLDRICRLHPGLQVEGDVRTAVARGA